MKAYEQGTIRVQMLLNKKWQDAILKDVSDASAHLFSIKAAV